MLQNYCIFNKSNNNETYRQIALSQLSEEELGEGEEGGDK